MALRFKDMEAYNAWQAEREVNLKPSATNPADLTSDEVADSGKEAVLAGKIVKYCKEHGFPCQCFRQSKKAKGFLVPGLPD